MRGMISQIQRFSVADGPGVRTTVFLKGCPLSCLWCHNPETQQDGATLLYYDERCTRCGLCAGACPVGAHSVSGNAHALDRELCTACGACAAVCPVDALELRGRGMSANEVMETVLRDRPFYEATGGGLTVSGGEPLMQVDFTRALLSSAKEHGLHTCLDTAGWGGDAAELVPLVDLFLWDVKATDPDVHLEVTGVPWKPIEENLLRTDARGGSMRLRCPIIPGINAHARHMRAIAALAERLRGVQGIDLIPYHDLGQAKALAIERAAPRYEKLTPEDRETLLAELRANTKVPCGWHQ